MATVLRTIFSILVGMALAFALVVAVELGSAVIHPVPPGFTGTQDEMCKHVERYPHWVLGIVVALWTGTTYASVWVATRLGKRIPGIIVGAVLLFALVFNVSMLPYPLWFKISTLTCFPVAFLLGIRSPGRPAVKP
jgi:hypothetical protein